LNPVSAEMHLPPDGLPEIRWPHGIGYSQLIFIFRHPGSKNLHSTFFLFCLDFDAKIQYESIKALRCLLKVLQVFLPLCRYQPEGDWARVAWIVI
jgi:hypothetical protein